MNRYVTSLLLMTLISWSPVLVASQPTFNRLQPLCYSISDKTNALQKMNRNAPTCHHPLEMASIYYQVLCNCIGFTHNSLSTLLKIIDRLETAEKRSCQPIDDVKKVKFYSIQLARLIDNNLNE